MILHVFSALDNERLINAENVADPSDPPLEGHS